MIARWTIYLRETSSGWEWGRKPDAMGWSGYKTKGHAVSAAKRSINPVFGGKTKASDFNVVVLATKED
jgi:hypothetical protein